MVFLCENCGHRVSPSEPISALGDKAVGLCCSYKIKATIKPILENPDKAINKVTVPVHQTKNADFEKFIALGYLPVAVNLFHSTIDHPGKQWAALAVDCLVKAVNRRGKLIEVWVAFNINDWHMYFYSGFHILNTLLFPQNHCEYQTAYGDSAQWKRDADFEGYFRSEGLI